MLLFCLYVTIYYYSITYKYNIPQANSVYKKDTRLLQSKFEEATVA